MHSKLTYMIWYTTSIFKRVSSEFQSSLSNDIKRINEDLVLFIDADKTNNLCYLSKDNYNKSLTETKSQNQI